MAQLSNNDQGTWTASAYTQLGDEISCFGTDPLLAMMGLVDILVENQRPKDASEVF